MTTSLPNLDLPPNDATSQLDEQPQSAPKTSAATQPSNSLMVSQLGMGQQSPESPLAGRTESTATKARAKISSLLKDKEQEWTAVMERKGPLRLLDLPMDVLKEIVKEVTHTNDLTALALTHSALHNLAIPHIYSRFDIVWPDAHATTEPRTGVDALTYGLATLCMGNSPSDSPQNHKFTCKSCGKPNTVECKHVQNPNPRRGQRRLGNRYPQFIRKFSIGNGPADWVQEYLITKESGKMLGTLVALAVAKMVNLETFMWDMPTGVLRDVWLALSSLQDRHPRQDCRLERVWVRWHDNSEATHSTPATITAASVTPQMLAGSTMTSIGWTVPSASTPTAPSHPRPISYPQSRVEYPTLSVLPPLKSLSVLDIDELEYLDEMSILIANSGECLRELRVGISIKAADRDFALAWDGPELHQVDHNAEWPGASIVGERRLGGVLGVLLGRVFDLRRKPKVKSGSETQGPSVASFAPILTAIQHTNLTEASPINQSNSVPQTSSIQISGNALISANWPYKDTSVVTEPVLPPEASNIDEDSTNGDVLECHYVADVDYLTSVQSDVDSLSTLLSAQNLKPSVDAGLTSIPDLELKGAAANDGTLNECVKKQVPDRERLDGILRLQNLELEHVHLSVAVLQKAFDWTVLTSLTLLDCSQHERFWSMLRRNFQPSPLQAGSHSSRQLFSSSSQYHLNIKKVHTDAASPALIAFLKETLAPNTLETLFLQDRRRGGVTNVTIDAIYKGPLKRHRSSLKKLMLDSSNTIPQGPAADAENTRWRAWMPNRDVLNFITSGRMSSLRELSIGIDYRDWHHFLQRLPQIPHVRSLNIPFIADHVTPEFDPHELAMQVVDVIVLRPEVELCYMAVSHKCFEILENRRHDAHHSTSHSAATGGNGPGATITDEDEDEDEANADTVADNSGTASAPPTDAEYGEDEAESDVSYDDDDDTDSFWSEDDEQARAARLRLREILFYDDKVALFKARHGKL